MSTLLPFIVTGIVTGSVYALTGVGLVLTYKTSGIFNFAQGALCTLAAYLFYTLYVTHGVPWPVALFLVVGVVGTTVGVLFAGVGRELSRAGAIWQIAAMVGILVSLQALFTIIYGVEPYVFPHFLPVSQFVVGGVHITVEQVIIFAISLFATGILYASFRLTRVGVAMRAVVEAPELLSLARTSPNRVRRLAWIIGCSFAMLSGLLIAPSLQLDPTTLTLLVFQALGAAAIGSFSSIPMTWVGGIILGVITSVLTKYVPSGSVLAGLPEAVPFVILIVVLVLRRSALRGKELVTLVRPIEWTTPGRVQLALAAAVIAFLVFIPTLVGYRVDSYTLMLTTALLFMSFGLLVRVAGQVSLCQVGFAAVGAVAFSKLAVSAGLPWLPALLVGSLVAVPMGVLLAIVAARVSGGLYLALVSLGFGLVLADMFYNTTWMFGNNSYAVLTVPRPSLSFLSVASDKGFYYVVLLITVLVAVALVVLTRTRLGRLLRGVAESPIGMRSVGFGIDKSLVLVFAISAFVAALSGALQSMVYGQATAANFPPFMSFTFFAVALISVGGEPWYALLPAAGFIILPLYVTSANTLNYLDLTFGVGAVMLALAKQPKVAFIESIHRFFDRFARPPVYARLDSSGSSSLDVAAATLTAGGHDPGLMAGDSASPVHGDLAIRDLRVRFGGLVAVQNTSLTARAGKITGLIGPNGAGKTTTINACSGVVGYEAGQVVLGDRDLTGLGTAHRARLGLGRTFQLIELADALTVWENVVIGREGEMAGGNVARHVISGRGDAKRTREAASRAIVRCGLEAVAGVQVGSLSSSQRRFVEIARCLAGSFSMLLLDEPSSGLDVAATERLGVILRTIVSEDGIGILLVEHDMSLVMSVCDYIYVTDFGTVIYEGEPSAVQKSEVVRAAYLGGEVPAAVDGVGR